jgi:pyridoxamine 5'-phosphate oxidase
MDTTTLIESLGATEPLAIFGRWLAEAETSEPNDPNAAALATCSAGGEPSVRMVLVKRVDERGFCFFSNADSRKGAQLAANPRAALCFHWKSLRRQVRVEGPVADVDAGEADDYFHSRSRRSQLGAVASLQSRSLPDRATLEERVRELDRVFPAEIPRPSYWRGFRLHPTRIEFWLDGPDRLHDRFLFTRKPHGWDMGLLYP